MELTAPQEASVVTVAKSEELKMPKRTSLPSILPIELINSQDGQPGVATFRPPADQDPHQKKQKHRRPHRPAMPLVFYHPAQIIGQAAGITKMDRI